MQRRLFLIGMLTTLAACARPKPLAKTPGTYEGQKNPLVGQHVDVLIQTYGNPDKVLEIGTDRSAYVYQLGKLANSEGEACNDAYVVNNQGRIIDYHCR